MMNHITEILPDIDKMPDWAKEAFEAGQFFDVAFKRVEKLERKLEEISLLLRQREKDLEFEYELRVKLERQLEGI